MADIGATLREARMRAKIDINEVETRTKIRAKYLRAIENEEWDLLPGDVYVKSFLRTYGDFLGLDSRPLIPPWALIGVVLVGVVVALYFLGANKPTSGPTTATHQSIARQPRRQTHHRAPAKVRTAPATVKLQLTATGPVYVCVVDGTGKKLIPGQIFNVGQTIPSETKPKLLITLGNASVKMKVNGTTMPVAPSSSSIGYLLTPTSHASLPPSKQPRCA
jgi:cytoskeleton protein RodZ